MTRARTRRAISIGAALGLGLAACAPTRSGTTWADDRDEGLAFRPAVRLRAPAPPAGPAPERISPGPRQDPDEVARALELELLRFSARRRALSAELGLTTGWPEALRRAWRDLVDELAAGLRLDPGALGRRVLVQARVAVEAELELTVRRHGPAPRALERDIGALYVRIATHMRRARPADSTRPRPEGTPQLVWPVSPLIVTSPFGYRRDPILGKSRVRFHAGVDLGGRRGDLVVSAGTGRVIGAGWKGGHGRTVTVQHPGGLVSRYAHLSQILVPLGAEVDAGSPLGLMGSSGRSTGPHLHFELRRGSVPVDPLELVGGQRAPYAARR